jgi:hypothetical protein
MKVIFSINQAMWEEQLPFFITYHRLRDEYETLMVEQAQLTANIQSIQTTMGSHILQTLWLQRDENRLKKQRRMNDFNTLEKEKDSLRMNLHNASLQLAPLFHLRPEEIIRFEELIKAYETTLQALLWKILILKEIIASKKQNLWAGALAEWWDLFVGKNNSANNSQIVSTVATVVSGRLASKALDSWSMNTTIEEINQLWAQLNAQQSALNGFAVVQKPNPTVLKNIPSLQVVEYIDILTDILRPAKDWWSIASLLALWYTWVRLSQLSNQLDTFQESTRELIAKMPQITDDINTVKFRHSRLLS